MAKSRSKPPPPWLPTARPPRFSQPSWQCLKSTSRPRGPALVSQPVPQRPTRLVRLPLLLLPPLLLPPLLLVPLVPLVFLVSLVPLAAPTCPLAPHQHQPLLQHSKVRQPRPRTAVSSCPWCSQLSVSLFTHKRVPLHHDDGWGRSREKKRRMSIFMSFLNQSAFHVFPAPSIWLDGRVGALIKTKSWVRGRLFALWRLA